MLFIFPREARKLANRNESFQAGDRVVRVAGSRVNEPPPEVPGRRSPEHEGGGARCNAVDVAQRVVPPALQRRNDKTRDRTLRPVPTQHD